MRSARRTPLSSPSEEQKQAALRYILDAWEEALHDGIEPEMLANAALFAALVIALELGASAMILTGVMRWLGALALGGFTMLATLIALRFWELPVGQERFMAANAFFEHLGLIGGFVLLAWLNLTQKSPPNAQEGNPP